ncbi:uncharacterized protein LOC133326154 [Musca vetustissima]|uniref:uncharacterized protein LOC133326154 n=1 Tax=Musca vetustissima TaxID=27455 RepID=UPI002AB6583C|nr:uncharacterized protein LOC133326154 [Musca vetustissima]
MASNPYVKSLIWLVAFGGIGYGLLRLTEPSEEKLAKIRSTTAGVHLSEDEQKKILFLRKLQSAATENAQVYLKNRDDN